MKLFLKLFVIAFLATAITTPVIGQNSIKQMDKKTKAELKEYMKNPSSYRKMIKSYTDQIEAYELQVTEIQEDFYKADYLRILYYDSIQRLHADIEAMNPMVGGTWTADGSENDIPQTGSSMFSNTGTDYRVQIGAYRYFDFTELLKFNQPIGFEKVNGIIHYYLGSWTNANDAYDFAVAIRKLKIDDAFVTKYVDGSRIPYDHMIEGGGTAFNQE